MIVDSEIVAIIAACVVIAVVVTILVKRGAGKDKQIEFARTGGPLEVN